jgi:hypothetical protein
MYGQVAGTSVTRLDGNAQRQLSNPRHVPSEALIVLIVPQENLAIPRY